MKSLGRRVLCIEAREQLRQVEHGPSHLIVMPDEWPEAACRITAARRTSASQDAQAWFAHCGYPEAGQLR